MAEFMAGLGADDKQRLTERFIFWYERILINMLTFSWIYCCYNFLVYSEELTAIWNRVLMLFGFLRVPNMFYVANYLSYELPDILSDEVPHRAKWHDVDRLAFWNERVGMFIVLIISNIVRLPFSTTLLMYFLPCIILFPFANILYFERFFIFGKNKFEEHHHHHNESNEVKEESGKIYEIDRAKEGCVILDLNKMPELEEEKEGSDDEFVVVERDDIIDKPTLEKEKLVKEMNNTSEEKYRKKLEKFEKEWEEKMKNVKERYKEKCKIWKQQENDFLSKLCSASSQAGFYQIQASDSEEKLRRLEDEKIELITKLATANASSELYRSLLHDPSSTQQYGPSF